LQGKGYAIPDYPEDPKSDEEKDTRARYAKCIGSAVNPVLREGNSDRRAPRAVKEYARKNPHSMAEWSQASRSHVSHMHHGDFYAGEKSMTLDAACDVKMELTTKSGQTIVLKPKVSLKAGEVIDSMFMSKKALVEFYENEIQDAYKTGVMFSLHVKATMMKVSHPIVFGHCVKDFLQRRLCQARQAVRGTGCQRQQRHGQPVRKGGHAAAIDARRGHQGPARLPRRPPRAGHGRFGQGHHQLSFAQRHHRGRLHAGHDPQWRQDVGRRRPLKDVKAVMPESTFARIYQEMINFCKWHGNFDPRTMGTVPNVGLMAQQAEEYGSHDKTFEIQKDGVANIVDLATGKVLLSQNVEQGDIWRMCQVKDAPIRDWVKLAVTRARNSGMPAVFWLDPYRPHEAELIKKVETYLKDHDTTGLDIQIMSQVRAMRYTLERVIRGLDTISVTGNILRDYLTDLFPIMELGTSAKMLSIVPLMAGGGMYETGAGGSAPKHVQQLVEENHLRWDSLGEFLALAVSLEDLGLKTGNAQAKILAQTLDAATGKLLENNKNPSPKTGQLDNRGSQFYLALYWAQALAAQTDDAALAAKFAPLADKLAAGEQAIVAELAAVQGKAVRYWRLLPA
jgi:isocitrate dehydrogenase